MNRTTVNFILDCTLALAFLTLVWITAVLRFAFPPATAADGWRLFGLSFDQWATAQFACMALFAMLVLLHVMLHWSWVCGVITRWMPASPGRKVRIDDSTQTLIGVAILVGLLHVLGALLLFAMLSIRAPSG